MTFSCDSGRPETGHVPSRAYVGEGARWASRLPLRDIAPRTGFFR